MSLMGFDKKGKLIGGILLVTGSCIGTGMLGMPVMSAQGGFFPSVMLFIFAWVFMMLSGFVLLEANLWFEEGSNLITLAGKTLGRVGQIICWGLFLFLFYSLLVALFSAGGQLVNELLKHFISDSLPHWTGSLSILFIFGIVLFVGTQAVDGINRLLMFGLVVSYVILMAIGAKKVEMKNLLQVDWKASLFAFPAMVIAFGFQNMIPSLTRYLRRDPIDLKRVIFYGSLVPLTIYLFWQALVLGMVPAQMFAQSVERGEMATVLLKKMTGESAVGTVSECFAFFALMTTFVGIALSMIDFLADGLSVKKTKKNQSLLVLITLLPPFLCSVLNPYLFLQALRFGGALVMILFGILPALMVWTGRYFQKRAGSQLLPGGKFSLVLIIVFSTTVILMEIAEGLRV